MLQSLKINLLKKQPLAVCAGPGIAQEARRALTEAERITAVL